MAVRLRVGSSRNSSTRLRISARMTKDSEGMEIERRKTFGSLCDLPVDILIAIMGFASPLDILTLRKVSKSVSHITRERSVWIDVLRRLSIQHDIYAPSFPLAEMTMEELEYAATTSLRFSARLRTRFLQNQVVLPASIRAIKPTHPGENFDHLRFLPGGRFILTTCGCTLRLWDLGNSPTNTELLPIASVEIVGATDIETLRTRASKSSSEALIIISTTESQRVFRVHIFSISPAASSPQFTLFAPTLALPMDGQCPSILGATSQHVTIAAASTTILWDFVANSWIGWPETTSSSDQTFYLCNRNILMISADQSQIHFAPFPALQPRSSSAPSQIPDLPILQKYELHRFRRPELLEPCLSGVTLVFHGRETSTVDQPMHIDILSELDDQLLVTHSTLLPLNSSSRMNESTSFELVALGETLISAAFTRSHTLHLEWVDHQSVQSFVVEGNKVHVGLTDVANTLSVSGILAVPGLPDNEVNVDFCSFSGRACARVASEEGFEVLVMDYLKPKQMQ